MLTPEELASLWIGCEGKGDEGLLLFLGRIEALKKSRAAANAAPISYLTEREKWLMLQAFNQEMNTTTPKAFCTLASAQRCWLDQWLSIPTGGGATVESDLAKSAPK